MKIYKVPTREDNPITDEHTGYFWTTSKTEAKKVFKEKQADSERGDEIEEVELAMNKWDVIRFLNEHCSHPDNG